MGGILNSPHVLEAVPVHLRHHEAGGAPLLSEKHFDEV